MNLGATRSAVLPNHQFTSYTPADVANTENRDKPAGVFYVWPVGFL
jgi:hypothetical protein